MKYIILFCVTLFAAYVQYNAQREVMAHNAKMKAQKSGDSARPGLKRQTSVVKFGHLWITKNTEQPFGSVLVQ